MPGMGELWRSLASALPASAQVVGVDFSSEMVQRSRRDWPFRVDVRLADVLAIDAHRLQADVVVSSFGLKTFSLDQQEQLARQVAQILKPGGSCSFIEISVPPSRILRPVSGARDFK